MKKDYTPSKKVLKKYADVLVNFALGGGKGATRGETVYLTCNEYAKPLYVELRRAILKAGGNVISNYLPDDDDTGNKSFNISRQFYELANDEQLSHFPRRFLRGLVEEMDHSVLIISDTNKKALAGIDPKKIMTRGQAFKPYMDWRN